MSEDTTREQLNARSLEERILIRLDAIDSRLDKIDERLQKLEAKEYDTKPIWEKVVKDVEHIGSELQIGLRRVGDKIDTLNNHILEVQADQREIERRLEKLESNEGGSILIQ